MKDVSRYALNKYGVIIKELDDTTIGVRDMICVSSYKKDIFQEIFERCKKDRWAYMTEIDLLLYFQVMQMLAMQLGDEILNNPLS